MIPKDAFSSVHDRMARQFAEQDRLMRQVTQQDRLMRQIADQDRLMRQVADQDRLMRQIADQDRLTRQIADQDRLTRQIADQDRLTRQIADQDRLTRQLVEPDLLRSMTAFPDAYTRMLCDQVPSLELLKSEMLGLNGLLDPLGGAATNHFLEQAARTTWLDHAGVSEVDVGLLSTLSPAMDSGTLTWTSRDSSSLHPGVWFGSRSGPSRKAKASRKSEKTAPPHSKDVEVRCDVDCMICGGPILSTETTLTLTAEGEVEARVSIFPICYECTRAASGSPDYWDEALERLTRRKTRPQLVLVQGGGETSEPRGREFLSLVRDESTD